MEVKRLIGVGRFKVLGTATLLVAFAMTMIATDVLALEGTFGTDGTISVDTTLSYTSSWRVDNQDKYLSVLDTALDKDPKTALDYSRGDANFDNGDQFLSTFRALVDVDVNWKGDYGVFLRASAFYDTVYSDDEDKFGTTGPLSGGPDYYTNDYDKFEDVHGYNAEILDAFAYGNFRLGEVPLTLRVGRQTIFWGESLLVFGSVATAMNPIDVTLANTPGAETKELIMPTGRAYAAVSTPNDKLTLAANYKYEWEQSTLDEAGSYFSTNNATDHSIRNVLGFFRGEDIGEDDGDEYGVALRYAQDNGDEWGLYFLNYRESTPRLVGLDWPDGTPFDLDPKDGSMNPYNYYGLEYDDNVKMYAATFSSVFAPTNTNYAVEVSYRPEIHVRLHKPFFTGAPPFVGTIYGLPPEYEKDKLLQIQANAIHLFGDVPGADAATGYIEWAYNTVFDHDSDELLKEKWATGGKAKLILDYFNVLDGLDLKVPLSIAWNPKGKTSYALSGLNEGASSFGIGVEGTYLGAYKAGASYTGFYGNPDDNNKTDRDYVSFTMKYTF
jgi:hypothetical protein